jgi:hypothetical protein
MSTTFISAKGERIVVPFEEMKVYGYLNYVYICMFCGKTIGVSITEAENAHWAGLQSRCYEHRKNYRDLEDFDVTRYLMTGLPPLDNREVMRFLIEQWDTGEHITKLVIHGLSDD